MCYCDNTAQIFYSDVTDGCLACTALIENCASCVSNAVNSTLTDCLVCADPYYVDPATSNSCILCDVRCTSCTDANTCSACATNLVNNGTFWVCDTWTDPTLTYYPATNMCVSCLNELSNCLVCTPDPLACTSCAPGTYISGSICIPCPSECATCDATGCLTCPLGTSGSTCACSTSCQDCQVTSINCLSCSLDASGAVTSCASCLSGFYIASDGISCFSCPDGCATCSTGGICTTCLSTFILTGTTCECDASLNLYRNGDIC